MRLQDTQVVLLLEYAAPARRPKRSMSNMLLIIIAILLFAGIFFAVVPIKFTSRGRDARISAARLDVADIASAIEAFRRDNRRLPTTAEGLAGLYAPPANSPNWNGPYLGKPISNDPWGNPYIFVCPGARNVQSFDLSSMGPDGRPGGGDDIDNRSDTHGFF